MKKLLSLSLAFLLLFSFCACTSGGEQEETLEHNDTAPADFTEIRIAVLNGTTGFGIAPLYNDIQNGIDHNMNAKIDFYADATLVAPLVIGGSVDIAAVPTNLAATLYNKTQGGIEVLAVNTLGVLYLIENGDTIHPVEIKKSGSVSKDWIRNFSVLDKIPGKQVGHGAVICLADNRLPINDNVDAVPIEYI